MSRTILINNVYSYRNKGDSAIIEAMMSYIREVAPDSRIVLLSNFSSENRPYYAACNAESAPHLWDIPMDDAKLRRLVRAVKAMLGIGFGAMHLPGANSQTMKLYRQCDAVIDAGGGSLYSSNRHKFSLGLYQHLFNLWFGKKIGKSVLIAPQSIGPFNSDRERNSTAHLLRMLDCVMIREKISSSFLREYNVPHVLVPDIAFLGNFVIPASQAAKHYTALLPDKQQMRVGVTVLDWRWAKPGLSNNDEGEKQISRYLDAISSALISVAKTTQLHVSIFPQVTAGYGDTDLGISQRLMKMIEGHVTTVKVAEGDWTPSDLCHMYGEMDAFVASRMHSAIFAITRGVPTLALAYQPKTIGTFELLNLGQYAKDCMKVTGEEIASHLHAVVNDRAGERTKFTAAAAEAKALVKASLDRNWKPILTGEAVPEAQVKAESQVKWAAQVPTA